MKTSDKGLKFIMNWEGTILKPYKDIAGIWTIGCGHVIKPGEKFTTITQEEAMDLLRSDISIAEQGVNKLVKVSLTQSMFDALCSFVFNAGAGALSSSTLLKKLNTGDYQGASQEFLKWCKAKDPKTGVLVENQGLLNRRKSESQMFMSEQIPVSSSQTSQDLDVVMPWTIDSLKLAQKKLSDLGLYKSSIDGIWGPRTEAALKSFISSKNLKLEGNDKTGVTRQVLNELKVV